MNARGPKRKGDFVEREIAGMLTAAGIPSWRVPLSGAAGGDFVGDIRVGVECWRAECKARKAGDGWRTLERWLAGSRLLFLRRNGERRPLVVLEWDAFVELAQNSEILGRVDDAMGAVAV
jgi:hypothetical protein